jgi:NNP family nitrate/nitrite transporter-like MFS transporter
MVTVSRQSPRSAPLSPWLPRNVLTLVVATLGLGLNLRAWILLGPHLHERFHVSAGQYALLMAVPVVVAGLARLPVGLLTDRYGARVMFPAVSLVGAAAVLGLGQTNSLPYAVAASAAAGVSGAAFVVGTALVSRVFPYGRRGLALGLFSLGTVVVVGISAVSRNTDPAGRRAAPVLGALLVIYAGLAALVLRDDRARHPERSMVRRHVELIRLASATSLSLLYLLALGGMIAVAVYLPLYLSAVFNIEWFHGLVVTGVVVIVASAARLAGGWWSDHRPTARLLLFCYAVAGTVCLVVALEPRRWWVTAPMIAAIAVCDGLASGALLSLIGKAARSDSAGAVMGVTGAVAAFGAVLIPLLLIGVDQLSDSYSTAWVVLAGLLLAAALYVRANGLHIGLGLAVRSEPEPSPTALTVAVVAESDTRLGAAAVVSSLAELAANDELVVVYGVDEPGARRLRANILLVGLRDRLPRHSVVALRVTLDAGALGRLADVLGEFVEAGTVAIAVTPVSDRRDVAARLSSYLRADRVLAVSFSPATGADLHEVWSRNAHTHP